MFHGWPWLKTVGHKTKRHGYWKEICREEESDVVDRKKKSEV